ncbi:unnamed protein product [Rhizoctonia solani]|uniref:DH domain-containing protein n=1 Tax=Rhizoctonia solani TaxID=456999 RepID=A0A8H3I4B9_9AGAM|nr:unnamed protein product [Rhizoctonia solani]
MDLPPPPPPKHLDAGYPSSPSSPQPPPSPSGRSEGKAKKVNPLVDLIDTEKDYIDQLSSIIRKVAAAWSRSNFPPKELDSLFRGVEAVYKANKSLNTKLKEIGPNPSDPKALGDLLMRWIDDLEPPYTRFINAYAAGFDTWRPVQQNPNLARILGDLTSTLSPGNPQEWTLDKLFALPPQRLKYYKKLYSRLLKTTSPGRSDHRLLVGANETLDRLMATCEERRNKLIGDPADHEAPHEAAGYSPPHASPYPAPNGSLDNNAVHPPPNQFMPQPSPSEFQLPPLSIHSENQSAPNRTFSGDAPTIHSDTATIIGPKDPNDAIPAPARVQSPEIAISNAFRRPVDGERVSISTTGSRVDSGMSISGERMSRDTTFSSMGPGSVDAPLMPAQDLERRLCTDRVMDIFSMTPRACKLQMNPPNLPYTRMIKFSVDAMIFFTPRVTGLEVAHQKAHLFLATDLLLICEKMTPEERAGFGPDGPDMWLCYPPLAGKHLQIAESDRGQGNVFQLTVMKKEVLTVHTESRQAREQVMRDIQECADKAASLAPTIRTNLSPASPGGISPGGLPRSPAPGDRGPSGLPPHPSSQFNQAPPQQRVQDNVGNSPGPYLPTIRSPPPGPMSAPPSRAPSITHDRSMSPMSLPPGPGGPGGPPGGQWQPPSRGASMTGQVGPGGPPGPPGPQNFHPGPGLPPPLRTQLSSKSLGTEFSGRDRDGPLPPIPQMPGAGPRPGGSAPSSIYSEFAPPRPLFGAPGPILSPSQNNFPRNVHSAPGSGFGSEYDISPPDSPIDEEPQHSGPVTQVITCETRCKVYAQQEHQKWKSLGAARLKLYQAMPTNVKQLVVQADSKSKNMLISTIVLTDGVERVGKMGIAIELSDNGSRTGVIATSNAYILFFTTKLTSRHRPAPGFEFDLGVDRPVALTNIPLPLILNPLTRIMSSGTQSPPLESTGEHQPIGAANKEGKPLKEGVKDMEQRAAYFGGQKNDSDVPNTGSGIPDEAIDNAQKAADAVDLQRH